MQDIIRSITEYVDTELQDALSRYIDFNDENFKIFVNSEGTIVLNIYFPLKNNDKINVIDVEWAIQTLKESFPETKIDFNYLLGENGEESVIPEYPIEITYCPENEEYTASAPDIENCTAVGVTKAEVLNEIENIINVRIEILVKKGIKLPLPSKGTINRPFARSN